MFGFFNKVFGAENVLNSQKEKIDGQITSDNNDGAFVSERVGGEGGYYAQHAAFMFETNSQTELIEQYRDIAQIPEVKSAIDEVVNEAISYHEDELPISISLTNIDSSVLPKRTCKKIESIWTNKLVNLLDLSYNAHRYFRDFYIDGIKAAHIIPDKNPKNGIAKIVVLDSVDIMKFREEERNTKDGTISNINEYFKYSPYMGKRDRSKDSNSPAQIFNNKTNQNNMVYILSKDIVAYTTSGMRDSDSGLVKGWLHDAIRPANQLTTLENALIIYRLTRAPERRVFYVDVGGLTSSKADQYLENLKNRFKNRMTYDPTSGSFKDKRHLMTMQEDFWMPRQNGRGTEVSTLSGGQNLGEIDDILYFQKKLYKALSVPASRLDDSGQTISFDRSPELSRDELKFTKYVSLVRKRFNLWLSDIIRFELLATKTITEEEWKQIKNKISFIYSQDFYLEEKKRNEMFRERISLASDLGVSDFLGTLYSKDFIATNILKMSLEEYEDQQDKISKEEKSGEIDELNKKESFEDSETKDSPPKKEESFDD